MMGQSSLLRSVGLAALLAASASAQIEEYTVWSSFIYLRAGDRTPGVLDQPMQLTTLGAQQMFAAGQYMRNQYIQDGSLSRIAALDANTPLASDVYAMTIDSPYTSASTQAFFQGLWPPRTDANNTSGLGSIVNGSVISNPLDGITYTPFSAVSVNDINSIYVAGDQNCRGFVDWASAVTQVPNLVAVQENSRADYAAVQDILNPVFSSGRQTFSFAKSIYDYVVYQASHNQTVADRLNEMPGVLARLKSYADLQQFGYYGTLDATNPYGRTPLTGQASSISTIAGSTLSSRILSWFGAIQTIKGAYEPLSVIVGDHAPMLSFFALANLTSRNSMFRTIPLPGSAMVFELVSLTNATGVTANNLPLPADLSVRFRFRNGTGIESLPGTTNSSTMDLKTFALFNATNTNPIMPFTTFASLMSPISMASPGDWCYQCGASPLFCAAWNSSLVSTRYSSSTTSSTSTSTSGPTPVVGGLIGAILTLAIVGLAFLLATLAGLRPSFSGTPVWARFHRGPKRNNAVSGASSPRSPYSVSSGGFKGAAKLASDPDLPRGGAREKSATSSVVVEEKGHGRGDSWEMAASPGGAVAKREAVRESGAAGAPGVYGIFPSPTVGAGAGAGATGFGRARLARRASEDRDVGWGATPVVPRESV